MFFALMIGTGTVVTSAMTCTAYLYRYRRRDLDARRPVLSIAITSVITGLQFVFPAEALTMIPSRSVVARFQERP